MARSTCGAVGGRWRDSGGWGNASGAFMAAICFQYFSQWAANGRGRHRIQETKTMNIKFVLVSLTVGVKNNDLFLNKGVYQFMYKYN